MKRIAYWIAAASTLAVMFFAVQWVTCFFIWQMQVNGGRVPDYTPESCVIDTTKERLQWLFASS